ncbi:hypothetical protein HMSSN036_08160 [Paenibacillus macerans]|nr:hypothetical protein HMSSN036_08160 [Paenibacillus macerans]
MVGVALQEAGFVSGQTSQPDSAVTMIISILLFGTLFFLAGGLIISYRYKLTKENHVVLLDEIKTLEKRRL